MSVQLPEFTKPMPQGRVKDLIDRHNQVVVKRDYEWFAYCGGMDAVMANIRRFGGGHEKSIAQAFPILWAHADPSNRKRYYLFFRDTINKYTPDTAGNLNLD